MGEDSSSDVDKVDLMSLAYQAETLSRGLNKLRQECGHETTSTDISHVAEELMLLSAELNGLDKAVASNKEQYTTAFNEDLAEIYRHLGGIFDDISDCCREMQKVDGPRKSSMGWLHKKRYLKKLQDHLLANKTTLVIMRTVLHHGKDYGTYNSPGRLAESSPHTLQEDRTILESVFANRSAIADLRKQTNNKSHEHNSSTSSAGSIDTPVFNPGAHGRKLSSATGVDVLSVEDVLPSSNADQKQKKKEDVLARRFSRRGVRLAVHSSILDAQAHDVPGSLRKRWIQQARQRKVAEQLSGEGPSIAHLSKISEVNSSPGPEDFVANTTLHRSLSNPPRPGQPDTQPSSSETVPTSQISKAKKRSLTLMSTPVGRTLGKVIGRLGATHIDDTQNDENAHTQIVEPKENLKKDPKSSWTYRFTKRFEKPDLTTPDFNEDVESMGLR